MAFAVMGLFQMCCIYFAVIKLPIFVLCAIFLLLLLRKAEKMPRY